MQTECTRNVNLITIESCTFVVYYSVTANEYIKRFVDIRLDKKKQSAVTGEK